MKQVSKIFLYSETFGKRVSKLYDVSVVYDVCDKSSESDIYNNVLNRLINLSGYYVGINEKVSYDFK